MLPSQRNDLECEYEDLIETSKTRQLTDEEKQREIEIITELLDKDNDED